jgi:2-hydroxychromene-2-carboxylate isomerase
MQIFPESGGLPLPKRHPSRQHYRIVELQRWRDKRGLTFHIHPKFWPFDVRVADCVVTALTSAGADPQPFIARAFAATFEAERDLADEGTIADLLRDGGYESRWLERAKTPEIEGQYQHDLAQALAAEVFGSPSYVLDGEIFWGQDRLDLLDDALKSGRSAYSGEA